jgi:predicted MFS family arabinose efflux permease
MSSFKGVIESFKLPLGAYAAIWGCGFISMNSMPFMLESTVSGLGLNVEKAGLLGTIELLVVAATTLILAPKMKSLPRRNLAILGVSLALIGHALSVFVSDYWVLAAVRSIAGIGAGVAMAAGQACIAATESPAKTTARMMIIFAIAVYVLFDHVLGPLSGQWAHQGVYGGQALWMLLMLPLVFLLPKQSDHIEDTDIAASAATGDFKVPMYIIVLSIGVVLLYTIADASVWSFTGIIATDLGMSNSLLGKVLGISLLIGAIGGYLATWVETRYSSGFPYVVALVLSACCALMITSVFNSNIFISGIMLYGVVYTFAIPFLYKLSAELDRHGRIIVAASGSALVGAAIGPSYSALMVSTWQGYELIGYIYCVIAFCILLMSLTVLGYINGRKEPISSPVSA